MKYVNLETTGVQVSELCLGTMTFGKEADRQTSTAIYRRCREAGINFFDCANAYSNGEAERILGNLIIGERHQLILTSKVGGSMGSGILTGKYGLAVADTPGRLAENAMYQKRYADEIGILKLTNWE